MALITVPPPLLICYWAMYRPKYIFVYASWDIILISWSQMALQSDVINIYLLPWLPRVTTIAHPDLLLSDQRISHLLIFFFWSENIIGWLSHITLNERYKTQYKYIHGYLTNRFMGSRFCMDRLLPNISSSWEGLLSTNWWCYWWRAIFDFFLYLAGRYSSENHSISTITFVCDGTLTHSHVRNFVLWT